MQPRVRQLFQNKPLKHRLCVAVREIPSFLFQHGAHTLKCSLAEVNVTSAACKTRFVAHYIKSMLRAEAY